VTVTVRPRVAAAPGACNARTARCPDARDYDRELRPCCRGHVRALVAFAADELNRLGVTWWADYGTLLGAVRNPMTTWADYPWLQQAGRATDGPAPGIVPHDKDADLGVLFSSWATVCGRMRQAVRSAGFYLHTAGGRASMKVRVSTRNHTNVDLFFWKERPDGTLYRDRYAQVDRFKGKEFQKSALLPLTTVEWEGLTLPAPHDPEAFLAMRYGPGWRTPIAANNDGVAR
jgi:hypothetical protein